MVLKRHKTKYITKKKKKRDWKHKITPPKHQRKKHQIKNPPNKKQIKVLKSYRHGDFLILFHANIMHINGDGETRIFLSSERRGGNWGGIGRSNNQVKQGDGGSSSYLGHAEEGSKKKENWETLSGLLSGLLSGYYIHILDNEQNQPKPWVPRLS